RDAPGLKSPPVRLTLLGLCSVLEMASWHGSPAHEHGPHQQVLHRTGVLFPSRCGSDDRRGPRPDQRACGGLGRSGDGCGRGDRGSPILLVLSETTGEGGPGAERKDPTVPDEERGGDHVPDHADGRAQPPDSPYVLGAWIPSRDPCPHPHYAHSPGRTAGREVAAPHAQGARRVADRRRPSWRRIKGCVMNTPRLLLLIPPLTQLNTPYPSTAYLTRFLARHGYSVTQADVGIEMVLALLSRGGLTRVFD